ncbi:MAG TPA: lytic transglycosylase domain-containing protein [Conexibacter sp.]|jgi:soluble lytic murein transglycosylase|nr:lytic transglycosylase domain-containing protein [Conexibacter sp.]
MTTRTAQAGLARKRARRARVARRRRQALVLLAFVGVVGLGALLLRPLFTSAVHKLTALPLSHQDTIRKQAHEKRLDPSLIAGVIYAESKFVDSTSSAGALGLMQLLPDTARFIAGRSGGTAFTTKDLSTPEINIAYGSWYLRYLLDRYGGDEVLALAAYNGGMGNVDRWVAEAGARGERLKVADIPFPETRAYVERVLDARSRYRATYPSELGLK